jgi:hypothetical protein
MSHRASLILKIITILVSVGTVLSFLYYWETTRVYWKIWLTKDPNVFEQIATVYRRTDPAALIRIKTMEDAVKVRESLIRTVWGESGVPHDLMPEKIDRGITPSTPGLGMSLSGLKDIENLSRIDRLTIRVNDQYTAAAYHLIPAKKNSRLVLYHNGHGQNGVFTDQKRLISELIGKGYGVLAFNLVGYADNRLDNSYIPGIGWYLLHAWRLFDLVEQPLRYYLDPVIAGINYSLANGGYSRVDMIGFSAGGWVTVLASAIDPRINGSYTVAGPYPIYLRSGDEAGQSSRPHYYRPLLLAANYLEMFVLATLGGGRRQVQIFNQYDGCCFKNRKGKLYEKSVQAVVQKCCGGKFDVIIDRSHTRHAISRFARALVFEDMARRK